ncbi:cupin domain-containing protein [Tautonia marina]|uniref:cupin domain-containing protein n=1 Tax=Tautonia marina TaxID=2653855 RepID=UPI001260B715|nr:cupin domain-containing protein [Tautonia marina]
MALNHAKSGEVIDVRPLGSALADARTTTLVKADRLEVLRLVLPAGKAIAEHRAPGPITVHCLEGRVAFSALGEERELEAGRMLHLEAGEPHALRGIEDASLLVTIVLGKG